MGYAGGVSALPFKAQPPDPLAARLARLQVRPEDVEETFVRSGGHGGQNVNKTSTCVMLHHRPTGTRVKAQDSRHQAANREEAWHRLLDKIEARRRAAAQAERERAEKARRQSRPPSRRAKARNLASKAIRAARKELRRPVRRDD